MKLIDRIRSAWASITAPSVNRCRDCGTTNLPANAWYCVHCGHGPAPEPPRGRRDDKRFPFGPER